MILAGSSDLTYIVQWLQYLGAKMTELQAAIAALQTSVQTLSSAVTAAQAHQYSTADVANVKAANDQVQALLSSLNPPAPAPAPSDPTPPAPPAPPAAS